MILPHIFLFEYKYLSPTTFPYKKQTEPNINAT